MNSVCVTVRPTQGGWMLAYGSEPPLVFLSGGRAEAGAHRLGQSLATAGADATVIVHDRAGQVVGATRYRGEGVPGREIRGGGLAAGALAGGGGIRTPGGAAAGAAPGSAFSGGATGGRPRAGFDWARRSLNSEPTFQSGQALELARLRPTS